MGTGRGSLRKRCRECLLRTPSRLASAGLVSRFPDPRSAGRPGSNASCTLWLSWTVPSRARGQFFPRPGPRFLLPRWGSHSQVARGRIFRVLLPVLLAVGGCARATREASYPLNAGPGDRSWGRPAAERAGKGRTPGRAGVGRPGRLGRGGAWEAGAPAVGQVRWAASRSSRSRSQRTALSAQRLGARENEQGLL